MNINFTISFPDGYFQTWQKGFLQMITFICLFSIDSNVQWDWKDELLPVETIVINWSIKLTEN